MPPEKTQGSHATDDTLFAAQSGVPGPVSALPEVEQIGGRYRIEGLLGSGGMGAVYRARDVELDEVVALKRLRRELTTVPGVLERFRREVKLARRVTHKNVARVFDIGEHQGEPFLTMEFIEGEPLSAVLAREGPLSFTRLVAIAGPVCDGLGAAHTAGVVHRDLKPDNIMIGKDGRVVITDFGIARAHLEDAAQTMQIVGTPAYMAPEQIEPGGVIDARTDIYALGAVLYELATGVRAWRGESPIAVAAARLVSPPPDPRTRRPMPSGLADVILRCMARMPEDRYPDAAVVARALAEVAASTTATSAIALPTVPPARGSSPTVTPPPATEKTVALLPFRNAGDPGDEYLADGLTEDVIDTLSMTRGLRVRSRGTVMPFKDGVRDPREVGRELDVQVVVEGSVRRTGDRVRISARVSSVEDGFQLWAKRFDRPESELLVVSDELAHAIASALLVDLDAPARSAVEDPAVVDLYLRARLEMRSGWRTNLQRALPLLENAHARAPDNPTVLSALAMARARLTFMTDVPGLGAKAREAAEQAIRVAPELGDVHVAMALVLLHEGNAADAARSTRAALLRAPGNAEAHGLAGRILAEVAPLDEGIRRLEMARQIDPHVVHVPGEIARLNAFAGRWELIDGLLAQANVTQPVLALVLRGRFAAWRRDRDAAMGFLRNIESSPEFEAPRMLLSFMLGEGPAPSPDDPGYRNLLTGSSARRKAFALQMQCEIALFRGAGEEALAFIELARQHCFVDRNWYEHCPLLDPLRHTARYEALRADIAAAADKVYAAWKEG